MFKSLCGFMRTMGIYLPVIGHLTLVYGGIILNPDAIWQPDETKMELVDGFDRGSASYIG